MANSFDLQLKRVGVGVSSAPVRAIGVLLIGGLLALLALWQTGLLGSTATGGQAVVVESISLPTTDSIVVGVRNGGSDDVTVAQVQVDSAYWTFTIEPGATISPSGQATITLPYLWVQDEPHTITIVTGTGAVFEETIESAQLGATR
ncbi:MAG TPA: hypothetical protein VFZ66_21435 [Herpetosiphonaceae bacterium]